MQPSTSDIFGGSMDGYGSFDPEKEVVLRLEYISAAEAKARCRPCCLLQLLHGHMLRQDTTDVAWPAMHRGQ